MRQKYFLFQYGFLDITFLIRKFVFLFLQILNLTQAVKDGKSPVQLVQMPVVVVERGRKVYGKGRSRTTSSETFTQTFGKRAPFFSWC